MPPRVSYKPLENEIVIECRPNHFDGFRQFRCDCTKLYPKTAEKYKEEFTTLSGKFK